MTSKQGQRSPRRRGSKPYAKPTLLRFGDVGELTQALGNAGMADGGAIAGMTKSKL